MGKKTARAAVMTAPNHDLQIIEYPLPQVEMGCILTKVTCCTICGSVLQVYPIQENLNEDG